MHVHALNLCPLCQQGSTISLLLFQTDSPPPHHNYLINSRAARIQHESISSVLQCEREEATAWKLMLSICGSRLEGGKEQGEGQQSVCVSCLMSRSISASTTSTFSLAVFNSEYERQCYSRWPTFRLLLIYDSDRVLHPQSIFTALDYKESVHCFSARKTISIDSPCSWTCWPPDFPLCPTPFAAPLKHFIYFTFLCFHTPLPEVALPSLLPGGL